MEDKNEQIGLKNELLRKAIHLSSFIIPISYYFLEKNILLIVVGIGTVFMILLDIFRKTIPVINNFYIKVMGFVLRKKEINVNERFLTGGTYYAIGVFLAILLFKREIAAPAIMIMIICDTFAALIGKKFGKHNLWNKTIEGSVTFFILGVAIVVLTPKITTNYLEYIYAVIALFIVTIIEALPFELDDNITIPVSFGIIYTLFLYLL
ncbi:MAG: SEC59/DGK1/VTE5 family protein [Ignavibacteriae bacterium]|nr:SEC59/DGK1/VTE5 family protein [Ignavibacteriota bacterium]